MADLSLRRRLLRWLLLPLLPILFISAAFALRLARQAAQDAFDLSLLDAALDLSRQVSIVDSAPALELPTVAKQMLATSVEDKVIYSVSDQSGRHIAGDANLPIEIHPGGDLRQPYYDAVVDGVPFRAMALRSELEGGKLHVDIAVAQTLKARDKIFAETLASLLLPELLLVAASLAVVWFGVRHGLVPAERLRNEIVSRSPKDLRPIAESTSPNELRPIVHAINELLQRLSSALGGQRQFIADAAHQLRTPLAVLRARIELAMDGDSVPPQTLHELLSATERTTHLANQLLSLARAEHIHTSADIDDAVDLEQLAIELAEDWVPYAARRDIELTFELTVAVARGNRAEIRELLANLLDNALRYTPAGGLVTVRSRATASTAILEVEDNGPGIAAEFRDKVRTRFYRLDNAPGDGCGLGLAIVDEIASAHDAQLRLAAGVHGRGLLVSVEFPQAADSSPD